MSLQATLKNPLDRIGLLPTTMNWRGLWVETEQYFIYDLVVSSVNSSTYILLNQTALKGGDDPTTNADWAEFSATATGVQSVTAGLGIENIGTTTEVILQNTGVRTLEVGSGLALVGSDPQNPTIINTGVNSITQGAGINVQTLAIPNNPKITQISNTGVLSVATGNAGITIDNTNPQIPVISNTGVYSVTSGNAGISVNTANNIATINNTGVLSFNIVGTGLSNSTGTATDIKLQNTGILTVSAGIGSGITITGDAQNPQLASYAPQLTQVTDGTTMTITPSEIPSGTSCIIGFVQTTGNLWATYLANGDPSARDGYFVIDLSRIILSPSTYSQPIDPASTVNISIEDAAGHSLIIGTIQSNNGTTGGTYTPYSLGGLVFRLAAARSNGLNSVSKIVIGNNTGITLYSANTSAIYAVYYPDGQT
jgi:hypothetical protein